MVSSTVKKTFFALALSAWISSTEGQVATCISTSPQCCWVVRIWQLMGQTTSVSPTSSTACCTGIPGVTCSSSTVTELNWAGRALINQIPAAIGNLRKLTKM